MWNRRAWEHQYEPVVEPQGSSGFAGIETAWIEERAIAPAGQQRAAESALQIGVVDRDGARQTRHFFERELLCLMPDTAEPIAQLPVVDVQHHGLVVP